MAVAASETTSFWERRGVGGDADRPDVGGENAGIERRASDEMAVAASETTLVWSDTALGETPTVPTPEGKTPF